ncbi:MAG TPA: cytochrome c nitrite reductase small subunit [Gemmatimonadaceae bacterium]|nr:cytochrome c nitrite reductase small subunit [Gemmatimonadaceae bacterium]
MKPPSRLAAIAAVAIGITAGLGAFTFVYARGYSYLTNDPAACANCHIMSEHYSAWIKSSHHSVATCNDCHTPHTPVGKYVTKARNGFWHSFYFTTGRYPDPLRITEGNRRVTEHTCRYCHAEITAAIDVPAHRQSPEASHSDTAAEWSCVRCHRHVGHVVR